MKRSRILLLWMTLLPVSGCVHLARQALELPQFTDSYGRHEVTMVAMRDGVKLYTDIYYPEGEGPWPAILVRNPYNMWNVSRPIWTFLTRYGYVVINQDVRGRFGSVGEWLPLMHERNDGIDTVTWLLKQPWQNRKIGLLGASYLGAVQLLMADLLPPEVKVMVPTIIGTDLQSVMYEHGMFRHELWSFWAAIMPGHKMSLFNGFAYQRMIRHWPQIESDVAELGVKLPWYRQWLQSQSADGPLWNLPLMSAVKKGLPKVHIPTLFMTGWYDLFPKAAMTDYLRIGSHDLSRIIIGPWTHLLGIVGDGQKPFPEAGSFGSAQKVLNWLNHYLKGEALQKWGPVATYTIGEDRWRSWDSWPPPTQTKTLYFRRASRSRYCKGLLDERPGRAETVRYIYDPEHPVPSRGGAGMLAFVIPQYFGAAPSNRDQKGLCKRADVLTFVSPPLKRALHIAGAIRFVLKVASSARDTAFTAKLIEVAPDGTALNIRDSISSLAYRNDPTRPTSYRPAEKVDVNIDTWPIEWELKKGYRLRVDISSSNFPAYARHSNRAGSWALQKDPLKALQTVYIGDANGSRVELPIWLK